MVANNIDGKIKTFSEIPSKWDNIHNYHLLGNDRHKADGFYPLVYPTLTDTQKRGEPVFDATNEQFTYAVIDKSPEELERETAAQKEIQRAEIKERYVEKVIEREIALNPTDAAVYFDEWTAGTYQIDDIRNYKGKTYENTVADNTNAPDKGGWIEIK